MTSGMLSWETKKITIIRGLRAIQFEAQKPEYLLFLLAKCVKAAVRYNAKGEFNQSPDKRRLGRNPAMMRDDILGVYQGFS